MATTYWVNHECEGRHVSVGPFATTDIADTFRVMMFADPQYGTVNQQPDGNRMTVGQYSQAFRADLNTAKGEAPAGGWH